jgi:hypothetical protein
MPVGHRGGGGGTISNEHLCASSAGQMEAQQNARIAIETISRDRPSAGRSILRTFMAALRT